MTVKSVWRVTSYKRVCSAHFHSIVLAFCSPRGSHASLHYLLSPPVMAVCYYGNRPCSPLEREVVVKKDEGRSKVQNMMDRQRMEGAKHEDLKRR